MVSPSSVWLHMTAEAIQFGLERSEPIGLMAADVGNTPQVAGVIGKRGDCRDHRRQLRGAAQIKIDSVDMIGSLHPKVAAFAGHLGAKVLQDLADCIARLDRSARPIRHRDRSLR